MSNGAKWYWRRATAQGGPVTWERLQMLATAGKLGPRDFVRREDWADWKLACQASEHDDANPATPVQSAVDRHGGAAPPALLPTPPPEIPQLPSLPPLPGMPQTPAVPGIAPVVKTASDGPGLMPGSLGPPPLSTSSADTFSTPVHERRDAAGHADGTERTHADAPPPPPSFGGQFPFREKEAPEPTGGGVNALPAAALAAALAGLMFLALPLGVTALALGSWSLMTVKRKGGPRGKGIALAGLALGAFDVGTWLFHTIVQVNAAGV